MVNWETLEEVSYHCFYQAIASSDVEPMLVTCTSLKLMHISDLITCLQCPAITFIKCMSIIIWSDFIDVSPDDFHIMNSPGDQNSIQNGYRGLWHIIHRVLNELFNLPEDQNSMVLY